MTDLPAESFTYPSRPAASFEKRWKAIKELLTADFGTNRRPFWLLDLGSGTGYFSLQVATHFPKSKVVAVDGAVGVGNEPDLGRTGASEDEAPDVDEEAVIAKSPGVVKTVSKITELQLTNCRVVPERWSAEDIAEEGRSGELKLDCVLALSVLHDIERLSRGSDGGSPDSELCMKILVDLMLMAAPGVLVVEMPPAIKHYAADGAHWARVYAEHRSANDMLLNAAKQAFGVGGSYSIDKLYEDSDYDGREMFVVRGIRAENDLFEHFNVLTTGPEDIKIVSAPCKYPKHWISRAADFKNQEWCYVELADASEELQNLRAISEHANVILCTAFRLENKMAWERYAEKRDAIVKRHEDGAHPTRTNISVHPPEAHRSMFDLMKLSEKAGEMLLCHGNKTNALQSIGEKGLCTANCNGRQVFLANRFGTSRGNYTTPDTSGSALSSSIISNIVPAAVAAAAKGRGRKKTRGNDGSSASSSAAAKWTNQRVSGKNCRYTFLCRVLVDHATSNNNDINNQILTFNNDAHIYPEYLMVTL